MFRFFNKFNIYRLCRPRRMGWVLEYYSRIQGVKLGLSNGNGFLFGKAMYFRITKILNNRKTLKRILGLIISFNCIGVKILYFEITKYYVILNVSTLLK